MTGVAQVTTAIAGAATGVLVARLLGPAATGQVNVVLSGLLILNAFGSLGVGIGATYYVSKGEWRAADALPQVQLAALVLGLAGGGFGVAAAVLDIGGLFQGVPLTESVLVLLALPFFLSWTFTSSLAVAVGAFAAFSSAFAGQALAVLVLSAALAIPFGVQGAILALGLSHVATASLLLLWARRRFGPAELGWFRNTRAKLSRATRFGVKAYTTSALQFLNQRVDLLILNATATTATVGHYAVAISVTSLMFLLPRALSAVLLPRIAALGALGEGAAHQEAVSAKAVRHILIIVGASSAVLLVAVLLIPLIFGSAFRDAVTFGLILLPGSAALGVGNVLWATVTGKGRPEYSLYATLAITPPTVALFLLTIPSAGAVGAATVSTASYFLTALAGLAYFLRVTGVSSLSQLLPTRAELADYGALGRRTLGALRRG